MHAALERSREGNLISRTWRGIRGEQVGAELELDVSYSKRAIDRLVKRVSAAVDEAAVDASVDLENGDVTPQESKDGPPAARQAAQAPGPPPPARRRR